jgi:flotillin
MKRKLEKYRLDRIPEIVSQMMKPVEKIDSIRIHQVSGFGSSSGGGGAAGGGDAAGAGAGRAPVTQVMDSILGMALQLPALKSIGDQIGVDFSSAVDVTSVHKLPAGQAPGGEPPH